MTSARRASPPPSTPRSAAPRIRELARGKRSACIVVDDLTRPTPAERLVATSDRGAARRGHRGEFDPDPRRRRQSPPDDARGLRPQGWRGRREPLRAALALLLGQLRVRRRDQPGHAGEPQQRVPRRGSAHPHRQHPAAQQDRLLGRRQAGPARRRAHRHGRRLARSGGPDDGPGADRQRVAPRRRGGGAAGGRGLHRQRDPQHPPRDRRPRRRRPRRGAPRRRGDRAPHLRDQAADRRRRVRALRPIRRTPSTSRPAAASTRS